MSTRVAVVTGGTGHLGQAVVHALLADGWRVHVPVRSPEDGARLLRRHAGHEGLTASPADLEDADAVEAFFARVATSDGRLDLLANLAGGFAPGTVEETDPATWARMWQSNATVPFLAVRAAIPHLRSTGGGAVVSVASASAVGGAVPGMSAYLAAKSALVSLTRSTAEELAADGITVNAVAPTIIDTPATRAAGPGSAWDSWLAPEEVADVIRFLAGPGGRVVTGNVIALRKG